MIKYKIVAAGSINETVVAKCIQTSVSTVRISNDGLWAILKYREELGVPSELIGGVHKVRADILSSINSDSNWIKEIT